VRIPFPIETERLLIRPFEPEDRQALAELYADPEVMRYIPYGVLDDDGLERVLEKYARVEEEHGFTFWAIIERSTGAFIGDAGFGVYEATGEPEVGYSLVRSAWHQGFASEAAAACLGAAFEHLEAPRVLAVVDAENTASVRVVERLGMERQRLIDAHGRPHILFAKERP
jgi:ribosomal-protein-alanine N-acetyltransferase